MFRWSRKFSAGTTQKVVLLIFSNQIFRKRKMVNSVYVFFFQHKLTSDSGFLKISNNNKNQIPLLVPIALNLFFLAYDTYK